ncbi:TlpA family protein disulfide reductase [Fodinisporobacter ferrooxydans]|uniref:TlpA family protein disulfide reductase n=1 Tax=Fodinisporobacter ferrooxydans TaxID=2901836 RepID=A0ABY4CP63_9BACL|nr:TlpA family protein disulfide reductase [Alicyclobacillaceae bacterium MYW30-H2]
MKKLIRFGIPILVLFIMVAGIVYNNQSQKKSTEQTVSKGIPSLPQENYLAPDFTLKTIDGKTVTLRQLRGKPVFINIWNSWCPPCKAEMPDVVKEYDKYKDKIQFYGINLTTNNDSVAGAKDFINRFHVTFPTLMDTDGKVGVQYQIVGVPTSLFINDKGVIVARITGAMDVPTMEANFQKLIK